MVEAADNCLGQVVGSVRHIDLAEGAFRSLDHRGAESLAHLAYRMRNR